MLKIKVKVKVRKPKYPQKYYTYRVFERFTTNMHQLTTNAKLRQVGRLL